jgi:methylglutaconyl-CoA hydratase
MSDNVTAEFDASRGIATVTLNRPERHNAFDDAMIATLSDHFRAFAAETSLRALVLRGNGGSFSAGADLAWMQRMAGYDYGHNLDDARRLAEMLHLLKTLPAPTVARVQGNALGGAVGLIACCDIAIASDDARFGLTETRIGLIPATIGPFVLEALGPRWTRRLFLTGERFDAAHARELQLVHEVCSAADLDARVQATLEQLLACGPQAQRAAKDFLADISGRPIDTAMREDSCARIAHIRVSAEGQQGLRAFLEKRRPDWLPAGEDD